MTEMCKYFSLTAVLSWALISPAIALASETLPVLPSLPQTYTPFCYLQTPNGRIINLEYLCLPSTDNDQNRIDAESGQLRVISYEHTNNVFTGVIVNETDKPINQLKVNYEVLDEQGNQIDTGFIEAQPGTIAPGERAVFSGRVAPGAEAKPTFLEWSE